MVTPSDAQGIWKHWKLITGGLSVLFVAAVAVDVVLWYSLNKNSNSAAQTLNEIVANQPQVPQTPEEKVKLLDAIVAVQNEAAAKNAPAYADRSASATDSAASDPQKAAIDAKLKILDSLSHPQQ